MAALIAIAAIGLFVAGVIAGIIGMVSVGIRLEERNFTLTSKAPDSVTRAGRWLNGVYVRAPRRSAAPDRERTLSNDPVPEARKGRPRFWRQERLPGQVSP